LRSSLNREHYNFFHPFRVRYSEIDAQGIVFNAHYFTYFDTAITELITQVWRKYLPNPINTDLFPPTWACVVAKV